MLVTMDLSELITELEISRHQKDTLEVELLARTRENTILKSRLQELIDYGEGLEVKMPGQWSIEEQTTALRLMLRVAREGAKCEGNPNINFEGKDLPGLARQVFRENEQQWREVRRMERKAAELTKQVETLRKSKESKVKHDETVKKVNGFDLDHDHESAPAVHSDSGDEACVRIVDRDGEMMDKSSVLDDSGKPLVTSSKAKLKKSKHCGESIPDIVPKSGKPLSQLTDEEFCDLQIRLLEAGHELSKEEQLVVEEVTAKFNETVNAENMLANTEEKQQPCQVIMTGLSWGPNPGSVVRHARKYEGVTKIRVEGDLAIIEFSNVDVADKFWNGGEPHLVEGFSLSVGDVEMIDVSGEAKVSAEADLEEELKSSVAVRVRRKGAR